MNLWQDVRFGARLLVKDRWFTLAAATALALGIGPSDLKKRPYCEDSWRRL